MRAEEGVRQRPWITSFLQLPLSPYGRSKHPLDEKTGWTASYYISSIALLRSGKSNFGRRGPSKHTLYCDRDGLDPKPIPGQITCPT